LCNYLSGDRVWVVEVEVDALATEESIGYAVIIAGAISKSIIEFMSTNPVDEMVVNRERVE
jgi:hypothetical protein